MTFEEYTKSVLVSNPDFVAEMNERVATEYRVEIEATQKLFNQRMEEAKANWIKNRGIDVYAENEDSVRTHIMSTIPRFCYIKNVHISGDTFDVSIDLLAGTWDIC